LDGSFAGCEAGLGIVCWSGSRLFSRGRFFGGSWFRSRCGFFSGCWFLSGCRLFGGSRFFGRGRCLSGGRFFDRSGDWDRGVGGCCICHSDFVEEID
jgi:hypothetical protein